jgi:hypothetical protein
MDVCVDTKRPRVLLQASGDTSRGGVFLHWDVEDDNLDPATLRPEYRAAGDAAWQPVVQDLPGRAGKIEWKLPPHTPNVPLEVRLQARDKAGNVGEGNIELRPPYSESKP